MDNENYVRAEHFQTDADRARTLDIIRVMQLITGVDILGDPEKCLEATLRLVPILNEHERTLRSPATLDETTFANFVSLLLSASGSGQWHFVRPISSVGHDGKWDHRQGLRRERAIELRFIERRDGRSYFHFYSRGGVKRPGEFDENVTARKIFRFLIGEDIPESFGPIDSA
jgi:hypothetical protein